MDQHPLKNKPCARHPEIITAWECKNCGTPVCPQCALALTPTSSTRFCGEKCKATYVEYQEWLTHGRPKRTFWKTFSLLGWIKHLIIVAVLLSVISLALYFVSGSFNPLTQIRALWDLISGFFM